MSNLPKNYQYAIPLTKPCDDDLDAYFELRSLLESVKDWVKTGKGLFIYSEGKGNGKTSWACKIMNEYFRKVAMTNNMRCRGLYVNVPEFLQQLRNNMDNPSDELQQILHRLKTADLVIWDDIGCENPSSWVREQLYTHINYREANGLSQMYTSNLLPETLDEEKYLGERIVSRIIGQCVMIKFVGEDRRRV